jgi:ATP-binding cassette subfamily F protein uup
MPLIQLSQTSLAFGHVPLLDHVDLVIEPRERLGLIGRNGTGKSSLMKVLSGVVAHDDGKVWRAPDLKLAIVEQEPQLAPGTTVYQAVAEGLGAGMRLLVDYHEVAHKLEAGDSVPEAEHDALMERLMELQHELEQADGWSMQHRVETTLDKLSLPADRLVDELSGGLRKRVALARAMVGEPDLLLLDEPTNHLDVDSIEWLEKTLVTFPGSLLLVTHDRRFLDRVATRIIELDRGHLTSYAGAPAANAGTSAANAGSFAYYQVIKAEALAAEAQQARKFDKLLAQEEAWIRKGVEARRTRNEGRVLRLEALRLERAARRERVGKVDLKVAEADRSGKLVAELEHVTKAFTDATGEHVIVRDFSCRLQRGDKIGLIGANGTGKTTLLKLILGELAPDSGTVRLGTKLAVAYFDQFRATLDEDATLSDTISPGADFVDIGGVRKHVLSYLGDFLFAPERARSPVRSLSGGERNRLLLARLFAQPANVLVLDEPTNDLDIETLELLEELLQDFQGTLFLVSHDREFLDNVVTQTIASDGDGRWSEYAGGYSDWQRVTAGRGKPEAASVTAVDVPRAAPKVEEKPAPAPSRPAKAKSKLNNKESRELAELPKRIEALETEQGGITTALADPSIYADGPQQAKDLNARLVAIEAEMEALLARWTELEARS